MWMGRAPFTFDPPTEAVMAMIDVASFSISNLFGA